MLGALSSEIVGRGVRDYRSDRVEFAHPREYVSLWSADLLDVGRCIDLVAERADGFHIDVFDGHDVDELLFGPDFVAAVRNRTDRLLDVHLNVTDPDRWTRRFLDVGADMITVQTTPCLDVMATLDAIRASGAASSLGVELTDDWTLPRSSSNASIATSSWERRWESKESPRTPRRLRACDACVRGPPACRYGGAAADFGGRRDSS